MCYVLQQQATDLALPATQKAVLVNLAWRANDGVAWPSVARIAADVGRSVRTVQYALRALEAAGLITLAEKAYHHLTRVWRVLSGRGATADKAGVQQRPKGRWTPLYEQKHREQSRGKRAGDHDDLIESGTRGARRAWIRRQPKEDDTFVRGKFDKYL